MSETQVLLTRITALRQQLEQTKGLTSHPEVSAAAASEGREPPGFANYQGAHAPRSPLEEGDSYEAEKALERLVAEGSKQSVLLDRTLRQLVPVPPAQDLAAMPKQLTARARRILEEGRELLDELRSLADTFEPKSATDATLSWSVQLDPDQNDPLTRRYRETAAMANTALRMLPSFPDAASAQLSLCEGLETVLCVVTERIAEITAVLEQRRREAAQVETLARLLTALYAKVPVTLDSIIPLAEALLIEAQQAAPLRFLSASFERSLPPDLDAPARRPAGASRSLSWPARFVACHSLTVAQVAARIVRHDANFRADPRKPLLAALLHDAGMLGVPQAILAQAGPLDDTQRRIIEAHTRLGAELMARLQPDGSWLADAAIDHHERLDGTGYPAGRQEAQLEPLTRLIAVCDVYAALCTARPHRPARDTRTALTDTLLLAEQGLLDRDHAERLLQLSFYPVGSVVELADGALGMVVATHRGRRDLASLARPVLALLTDTQGRCLPVPHHVDLAECEDRSIVRTVPKADCSLKMADFRLHRPEF